MTRLTNRQPPGGVEFVRSLSRVFAFNVLAFAVLALTVPGVAGAQVASIKVEADRHIATLGETVAVTVSIVVEGKSGYDKYTPPAFTGFQMARGGMRSQNIEVVNWQVRRRETYSYQIIPLKLGKLKIGPAEMIVGGRKVKSSTTFVEVKKSGSPTPNQVQPGAGSNPAGNTALSGSAKEPLPGVFILADTKQKKVVVGQQVVMQWWLFTQSDVMGFNPLKQPTTDHFWSQDLDSPRRLRFERKQIQGQVYYAALLARKALFPQRVGRLVVGPMEAQVRTMREFGGRAVKRSSDPVTIDVVPVPEARQPSGFSSQNVGRFMIAASLDREKIKAGDAVTLKVVVRGRGNLRQLKVPRLMKIAGFKVYQPKVSEKLELSDGVAGEKIVEYLLLPTRVGRISIPSIRLDYFDPASRRYRKAETGGLTLTVTGKLPTSEAATNAAKKNVLGLDIRPPRSARSIEQRKRQKGVDLISLVLFILPAGALIFLGGFSRIRARLRKETDRSMGRATHRKVRQHLSAAKQYQQKLEMAKFFAELSAAISAQLDYRMSILVDGLTREELRAAMLENGFSEELAKETTEELDSCDFGRFAKAAGDGQQLTAALRRTQKLIQSLARASLKKGSA